MTSINYFNLIAQIYRFLDVSVTKSLLWKYKPNRRSNHYYEFYYFAFNLLYNGIIKYKSKIPVNTFHFPFFRLHFVNFHRIETICFVDSYLYFKRKIHAKMYAIQYEHTHSFLLKITPLRVFNNLSVDQ